MYLTSVGARLSSPRFECNSLPANATDTGTGILFTYETGRPADPISLNVDAMIHFGAPYFSVSFLLNFLLTIMIVTRLVLHRRNMRNAMGAAAGAGELYKATITILVESSAIYVISFLLYFGTWATRGFIQYLFLQMLTQTQVRTVFYFYLFTFDVPQSSPRTGHRSVPDHYTDRQPEGIRERRWCRTRER